ncbi:MAG TPA: DUF2946 domain-containing protein [Burkholderiales bacterium]|nr:DUF2946 domain-containing protein [Burkholderiales bacterium]
MISTLCGGKEMGKEETPNPNKFPQSMFYSSHRATYWVALFAVWFSAISPALAALRFYGNSEVLANIISVQPAVHDPAEHHHSGDAKSKAHEIYCSFCLDMASVQVLTLALLSLPSHEVATEISPVECSAESTSSYPAQHPRAPPFILR